MKLIIPTTDSFHLGTMIQDLEQKIANQYLVYPVMSNKAFEIFEMDDRSTKKLYHYTFGYVIKGRLVNYMIIYKLFNHLWDDIQKAWNPGDLVMWRRRPEVKEENDKDPGWFEAGKDAPDINAPDNWIVQISLRLGSFDLPKVATKIEGNHIRRLV